MGAPTSHQNASEVVPPVEVKVEQEGEAVQPKGKAKAKAKGTRKRQIEALVQDVDAELLLAEVAAGGLLTQKN